jgi:hypothetical protein
MHGLLTAAWSKITSSEVLVSRPSAVPRPIWTSVASPAQEHEWHHHILVLAILTPDPQGFNIIDADSC